MNGNASSRVAGRDRPIVLFVDDDAHMRSALRRLLRPADLHVELFSSGAELFARADFTRPGCLIVDMNMPDMHGLELQAGLAARDIPLPVIFLTGSSDIPTAVIAMRQGAVDFIEKPFEGPDLIARVQRAVELNRDGRAGQLRDGDALRRLRTLTPRERRILDLITGGRTSKEIARALGSSHRTIEVHRRNLMEKMAAATLADLVRLRLSSIKQQPLD